MLLGIGVAACGGDEQAATPATPGQATSQSVPATEPQQTEPPSTESPPTEAPPDDNGLGNPLFRKKLRDGDCSVVSDTETVIAQTSDPSQLAEAHLYHGLAMALCGGNEAAAKEEIDAVRAQADLLSPESRETLDQIGVSLPATVPDLRAVVAPADGNP